MADKIPISYLAISLYLTFVIASTLLVGLLPPLVNRPICDPPKARDLPQSVEADVAHSVHKRSVDSQPVKVSTFAERQKRSLEHYESELKRSPLFAKIASSRVPISELRECPEIQSPLADVEYPWYSERLPTYATPINYNIELLLDNLDINFYDGFIDIKFNVNAQAPYLLLHNGVDDTPNVVSFVDKDGNNVELNCVGNFPYLRNDYYIIKPEQPLNPALSPYTVQFLFLDFYSGVDNGIFKINYGLDTIGSMFLSKFRPIDARRAYPLFDEPGLRATYDMTIHHRTDFAAAFNTPPKSSAPDPAIPTIQTTKFVTTPPMPSDYIALTSFKVADFGAITKNTNRDNIPITLWARKEFIDSGFGQDPLDMSVKIFDAYSDIFTRVGAQALPPKIDLLVVPEYPVPGIGHFGLPIVSEEFILYKNTSASERDKQQIGLLLGQMFGEFWFGNFISQRWWDELWTQEGFANYIRYRAVDEAYPEWNLLQQFITDEMIETIIMDGFPSSHPIQKPINNPYEIEEYFDQVETTKTAAVIRMLENEFTFAKMVQSLNDYLLATPWGVADINVFLNSFPTFGNNWSAKDFMDRWTRQSNYPLVQVELIDNGATQSVKFTQTRGLNTNYSLFSGDILYPSEWDFVWYIPIDCSFGDQAGNGGNVREREYYLDQREGTFAAPQQSGVKWTWIHCDRKFVGFYELQYTVENWLALGEALKQKNFEFLAEDRAQIIHNLFLNAYSERGDYNVVSSVLDYLPVEDTYLPWRTVLIHVKQLASVLNYRKAFYEISEYFSFVVRRFELGLDLWNAGGSHIDELLKETIIDLACRMQDPFCLANATLLWPQVYQTLTSGNFENSPVPAFARKYVYEYHMENTYDVVDWDLLYIDFSNTRDQTEKNKLIPALTYSRLPWLLFRLLNGPLYTGGVDTIQTVDFFYIASLLSERPLGRELVWDKFRIEYEEILIEYGEDDPRIGQLLIDITESFENEFLFYELLSFVFFTNTGATANARFKALELTSTNIIWLQDKELEIQCAFSLVGTCSQTNRNPLLEPVISDSKVFQKNAREAFLNLLKDTKLEMFANLKKKLIK